jgi:peptide/nickel transport system permease protein
MSDSAFTGLLRTERDRSTAARGWASPGFLLPLTIVLLLVAIAIAPHLFTGRNPDEVDINALLQPPDAHHWFGTDQLGRDLYARIIFGTAQSLSIGLGATAIACLGGTGLGILAGLAPRPVASLLTRLTDILLAFPELLLALLVIAVAGRGPANTLLAVGLAGIAGYARLMRVQVRRVRLSASVDHAITLGERRGRIILRYILPQALRPLLILATVGVGSAILSASALSFLGLGVIPPAAEWGALLADGRDYLDIAPWLCLFPASTVAVSVIAITLFGRRLQRLLLPGGFA